MADAASRRYATERVGDLWHVVDADSGVALPEVDGFPSHEDAQAWIDGATDVSSGRDARQEKNARRGREDEEYTDLLAVLETPRGRRMIWRLVADAQPFSDPFAGPGMGEATAYTCGQQAWARKTMNLLHSSAAIRRVWLEVQEEADKHGW